MVTVLHTKHWEWEAVGYTPHLLECFLVYPMPLVLTKSVSSSKMATSTETCLQKQAF